MESRAALLIVFTCLFFACVYKCWLILRCPVRVLPHNLDCTEVAYRALYATALMLRICTFYRGKGKEWILRVKMAGLFWIYSICMFYFLWTTQRLPCASWFPIGFGQWHITADGRQRSLC